MCLGGFLVVSCSLCNFKSDVNIPGMSGNFLYKIKGNVILPACFVRNYSVYDIFILR